MIAFLAQAAQVVGQCCLVVEPPRIDFRVKPGQKADHGNRIAEMRAAGAGELNPVFTGLRDQHRVRARHQNGA